MKVGIVVERLDPALAVGRWAAGFARWLAAAGHSATVMTFGGEAEGVEVRLLARGATPLARGRAVAGEVAGMGAGLGMDLVLDLGVGWSGDVVMPWEGSLRVRQQRSAAGRSRFGRVRAAVSPAAVGLELSLARLERQQMQAGRVIAVSALVREVLVAQGVEAGRIVLVPLGAEVGSEVGAREAVRAELGVGDGVLFLGLAEDLRVGGMDTAITALDLLVYEGAEVRLAIAGAAPDAGWRRLAAASGERIRFVGPVSGEALAGYLAAADVVVRPARWDAGGAGTWAAVAAWVPVITTRWDGASGAVAEAGGAVLEDATDVSALAGAMRRLGRARAAADPGSGAVVGSVRAMEASFSGVFEVLAGVSRRV